MALVQELSELEARVASLRRQTGMPGKDEVLATQARMLGNHQLQSAIHTHQLMVANVQSSFSGYTNRLYQSPVSTPLHLPADWDERRWILLGMREDKVRVAHQFITERTRMMDPLQETCEESKFSSPEGDFYAVKMDNTPFVGVSSIQEVMQAFNGCFQQAEVLLSVATGSVITREGDEVAGEGISSHRFCTTVGSTRFLMGKNSVGFTMPVSWDADGPTCVVMAMDSVDQDDIYPYRPDERVRSDLSGVVQFRVHQATAGDITSDPKPALSTLAVVMTRWYHIKVHRTHLPVPETDIAKLQDAVVRLLDYMIAEIKAQLLNNRRQT